MPRGRVRYGAGAVGTLGPDSRVKTVLACGVYDGTRDLFSRVVDLGGPWY